MEGVVLNTVTHPQWSFRKTFAISFQGVVGMNKVSSNPGQDSCLLLSRRYLHEGGTSSARTPFCKESKTLSHLPSCTEAVTSLCSLLSLRKGCAFHGVSGSQLVRPPGPLCPSDLQMMTTGSLIRTTTPSLCSTPAACRIWMAPVQTATPSCFLVTPMA